MRDAKITRGWTNGLGVVPAGAGSDAEPESPDPGPEESSSSGGSIGSGGSSRLRLLAAPPGPEWPPSSVVGRLGCSAPETGMPPPSPPGPE